MPPRESPYNRQHIRKRAALLRASPRCVHCNWRPADEGDHVPPLSQHKHRNGRNCCRLVPSCGPCARLQGGLLRWQVEQLESSDPLVVVEPVGFDVTDPVWDVEWLDELRMVPEDAVWPRLMTVPHPKAVGSYGREFAEWVRGRTGKALRWWQLLVSVRLLEHDAGGVLVWEALVLSLARQVGKSWWLRELFLWRIHQADRFGEEQLVVHTGKDLAICKEVQRPARLWARARPDAYHVREVNGQEEIEVRADASRWLIRAKEAVYGLSATMAGVDEAWKVATSSIEEGIVPTMVEHEQSQLVLVSTAHRLATSLMLTRRMAALNALAAPVDADLLIEWSASRLMELEDVAGWRMASPHWSPRRERQIGRAIAAALAGETADPDEPDPIESVRAQWLNQWPIRMSAPIGSGETLLPVHAWESCPRAVDVAVERMWVAVEDNYGQGAAVAVVALLDDDRLEVDGWLCESRADALRDAAAMADDPAVPWVRLIVGASIPTLLSVDRAGARETRIGLPLVRSVVKAERVVHDDTVELEEQLAAVRVREVSGGLALVSGQRSDLVRAMSWAMLAAVVRKPRPEIR